MEDKRTSAERRIEHSVSRAFRTAHLLTGSVQLAESAVLGAIDSCDWDGGTEDALFRYAVHAAVQDPAEDPRVSALNPAKSTESSLPVELQAVLNLSQNVRRCFVLRVLAGWPRQTCARLLHLSAQEVDRFTRAALQRLAGFDPSSGHEKFRRGSVDF
jgi:hypothetical protein